MSKSKFCVFLDAGHGGVDSDGNYVTAPSKQFKHDKGEFHGDGWFYEGVSNRQIVDRVAEMIGHYNGSLDYDLCYAMVHDPILDTSLVERVKYANTNAQDYDGTIYISSHSNASTSHKARGFEVYTTPGQTRADDLASIYFQEVKDLFGGEIKYRRGMEDGDVDRERNFYVIRKTTMPAILIEHLFFDNYDDAKLLMRDSVIELFATAQFLAIKNYFDKLISSL